jgi:vanillate O-demethylase monooxygenase subunit
MQALRNAWYVAAWDHEVTTGAPFARMILGEPLVFWRNASGEVIAFEDRCCHRQAPLSRGRVEGDSLRCGYHGLRFDSTGRCIEIPGARAIPPRARVQRFPVVVHRRWVMVWMGQESAADHALLPGNFSCEHPDWRYRPGYLHYGTPWGLIADNLLDFSHLSYVHAQTLGGTDRIASVRPEVTRIQDGVRVSRFIPDVTLPPYFKPLWRYEGRVDRWQTYDFVLPATLIMHSGARRAGAAQGATVDEVDFHSCQALTPETADSTHYFFMEAHRSHQGDTSTTDGLYQGLLQAFEEDRQMILAQLRNLRARPGSPMLPLPMDEALVRFQRLFQQRLAAEAAESVPAKAPTEPSRESSEH